MIDHIQQEMTQLNEGPQQAALLRSSSSTVVHHAYDSDTRAIREQGKRCVPLLDAETFAEIAGRMRQELATKTKRKINRTLHHCFTGSEAVAWLIAEAYARDEREAVTIGNLMVNKDIIAHTSGAYPFTSEPVHYYFKRDKKADQHDKPALRRRSLSQSSQPTTPRSPFSRLNLLTRKGSSALPAALISVPSQLSMGGDDISTTADSDSSSLTTSSNRSSLSLPKRRSWFGLSPFAAATNAETSCAAATTSVDSDVVLLSDLALQDTAVRMCLAQLQDTCAQADRLGPVLITGAAAAEYITAIDKRKSLEEAIAIGQMMVDLSLLEVIESKQFVASDDARFAFSESIAYVAKEAACKPQADDSKQYAAVFSPKDSTPMLLRIDHRLDLRILEAKSLPVGPSSDEHLDTYCVVKLDSNKEMTRKTRTVYKSTNPQWDEDFKFDIDGTFSKCTVEVWARNRIAKNTLIGSVTIPRQLLAHIPTRQQEFWLPLVRTNKTDGHNGGETCNASCETLQETQSGALGSIRIQSRYTHESVFPKAAYEPLINALVAGGTEAVREYLAGVPPEDLRYLATTLMGVYEGISTLQKNYALGLVNELNRIEITGTHEASTVFRGNTLASKCMDVWMHLIGRPFLHDVLCPTISEVYNLTAGSMNEPDTGKMDASASVINTVEGLVDKTLNTLYQSVHACPIPIRLALGNMQHVVTGAFPEAEKARYTVVSAFLFLRFLNPAILSPRVYELADSHPCPRKIKLLLLASKTIQNVANQVTYGEKEGHLRPLNALIERHLEPMRRFIDELCSPTVLQALSSQSDGKLVSHSHLGHQPAHHRSFSESSTEKRGTSKSHGGSFNHGTSWLGMRKNITFCPCCRAVAKGINPFQANHTLESDLAHLTTALCLIRDNRRLNALSTKFEGLAKLSHKRRKDGVARHDLVSFSSTAPQSKSGVANELEATDSAGGFESPLDGPLDALQRLRELAHSSMQSRRLGLQAGVHSGL